MARRPRRETDVASPRARLSIALVSDFTFPRMGGVEMHIHSLGCGLVAAGHRVVVISGTHAPPAAPPGAAAADAAARRRRRAGVRYMAGGLKVYHLPLLPVFDQAVFPTYFAGLPLLRAIFVRERVAVVHGHAATSVLVHDALLAARSLGLATVFTDHSLFNFHDPAHVNLSKYLAFTLSGVDAAVAVSHAARENLVRRVAPALDVAVVHAIPNAVDATRFRPAPRAERAAAAAAAASAARRAGGGAAPPPITVVMLSRLVSRKGLDLAAELIPLAAAAEPRLRFVIGGDGPLRLLLEEMRERHGLLDRVTLLGAVPHADVPAVLRRGDVFLNTSRTESFCIAILEAAACGCFVVSTAVGGVPEVLPPWMTALAPPEPRALAAALLAALPRALARDADAMHAAVAATYSWRDVAARTVRVYDAALAAPRRTLAGRMAAALRLGPVYGPVTAVLTAFVAVMCAVLEALFPAHAVERAPELDWAAAADEAERMAADEAGLGGGGGGGAGGVDVGAALARAYDAARVPQTPTAAT